MIAAIWFDDVIVVPCGKSVGAGLPRAELRETSFRAEDGWEIREMLPGVFSLSCDGMPMPVTVGGYGYSYALAASEPVDDPANEGVSIPLVASPIGSSTGSGAGKKGKR